MSRNGVELNGVSDWSAGFNSLLVRLLELSWVLEALREGGKNAELVSAGFSADFRTAGCWVLEVYPAANSSPVPAGLVVPYPWVSSKRNKSLTWSAE